MPDSAPELPTGPAAPEAATPPPAPMPEAPVAPITEVPQPIAPVPPVSEAPTPIIDAPDVPKATPDGVGDTGPALVESPPPAPIQGPKSAETPAAVGATGYADVNHPETVASSAPTGQLPDAKSFIPPEVTATEASPASRTVPPGEAANAMFVGRRPQEAANATKTESKGIIGWVRNKLKF